MGQFLADLPFQGAFEIRGESERVVGFQALSSGCRSLLLASEIKYFMDSFLKYGVINR